MLNILSEKKRRFFYEQQLGQTRTVLFERSKEEGRISGFTDNYVKVDAALDENWINHVVPVRMDQVNAQGTVEISLAEQALGA